jgi:hypothetical protein
MDYLDELFAEEEEQQSKRAENNGPTATIDLVKQE